MQDNTHTHTLTFSLRNWKKGSQLLAKLGHNDALLMTETFDLNLDEWQADILVDDLNATTYEWTLKDNETGQLTHSEQQQRVILRKNTEIINEYRQLRKSQIRHLRQEWMRINRIGTPQELCKEALISDLLRAEYGNRRVDQAFKLHFSGYLKN